MVDATGTFVVVGGGIAGVTCAETLAFLEPNESIILVSESSLIKSVINLYAITKTLTHFDVQETQSVSLSNKFPNISVIHDVLTEIDDENHLIKTKSNKTISYKFICLCMGAEPKLIPEAEHFPQILGIRDTDSVEIFLEKLSHSKKIVVVGNGGIASELIHKIRNTEVHWVIKDKHISATFVDPGAAEFFQSSLEGDCSNKNNIPEPSKRMRYDEDTFRHTGAALGPDWYKNFVIEGASNTCIKIHYESEIVNVQNINSEYPIEVTLTNQEKIPCDLIISATGVLARKNFVCKNEIKFSGDGGICVNEFMQTNLSGIYAAGDVCHTDWIHAKHWFQMKLWTQARQMGCYAAKCMSAHFQKQEVLQDFCFELFAHSTKLFGYKVILLGLYNGQKLGNGYEILLRMTKKMEYIKFVLENNRLQGAVLIGETDLEEMCENLILNQLDLSPFGDDILNPDIDIEDYFD